MSKIIEFSDHAFQNLITFLARVDLKGSEVVYFNEIVQCLNNPIQLDKKEESK